MAIGSRILAAVVIAKELDRLATQLKGDFPLAALRVSDGGSATQAGASHHRLEGRVGKWVEGGVRVPISGFGDIGRYAGVGLWQSRLDAAAFQPVELVAQAAEINEFEQCGFLNGVDRALGVTFAWQLDEDAARALRLDRCLTEAEGVDAL